MDGIMPKPKEWKKQPTKTSMTDHRDDRVNQAMARAADESRYAGQGLNKRRTDRAASSVEGAVGIRLNRATDRARSNNIRQRDVQEQSRRRSRTESGRKVTRKRKAD